LRILNDVTLFNEICIDDFRNDLAKNSKIIGKEILYFESINSTNSLALKLIETGIKDGTVIIANEQLAGRGRFERRWISPAKKNLYMSIILMPELSPKNLSFLSLMTPIPCVSAIRELTHLDVSIKWPNDLIIEGKKLGGILIETKIVKGEVYAVLGIGINVNFERQEMPEEIKDFATSIMEEMGTAYSRAQIALEILKDLDKWYDILLNKDFEKIKKEWLKHTSTIGRFIKVKSGNFTYTGLAVGIDEEGMILLDTGDSIKKISSGDVTILK
jgi:BirA family biotin operon repressor/biotin-[acetyl-CoA-carboxylase] ligase